MPLTNQQYQDIMREYSDLRMQAEEEADRRRAAIEEALPGLPALERRIASLSVQETKLRLNQHEEEAAGVRQDLEEAMQQRLKMLADGGFSEADLTPVYHCPMCRDTGYITRPDGSLAKCRCFKVRETRVLYHQSNLEGLLEQQNFDTLTYEYHTGEDLSHLKGAVSICRDFVNSFETNYRNLLFCGTVGTGKSFLSCCSASALLKKGHAVVYLSSQSLFDALARERFGTSADEPYDFQSSLYDCELLIVDDLGTEMTNSFVETQLFALMNERALRRRSMIISTNLTMGDLQKRYTDRVASRILERYDIVRLTGPDLRTLR